MDARDEGNVVVEREPVFESRDYLFFLVLTIASLLAIARFLTYWASIPTWADNAVPLGIFTFMLVVTLANNQCRWCLLPFMRRPRPVAAMPGLRVGVATSFVPGEEPIQMLEQTLKALLALDYPHETWVLDEGDDADVKALCESLGVRHFSRRPLPQYQADAGPFQARTKHGNYNAWLHEIAYERYDIVTTFDPDHVPEPEFLSNVLGYLRDPRVAYVQAAQVYRNQQASFIARGAAEETYAYYSSVQMAAFGLGYPIIVGCHNTHRVSALREIGGFPSHEAEDLAMTLLYVSRGWRGVYVPKVLAKGLAPVDWHAYLAQQRRWARSVMDVKLRLYPKAAARMGLAARWLAFLQGINYVYRGLFCPIALGLLAAGLATGTTLVPEPAAGLTALAVLLGVLQICELYRQRFYLQWKEEWGLHWRVLALHLAKWPYFLLALLDVARGGPMRYILTPKVRTASPSKKLFWPTLAVFLLIGGSWVTGLASGRLGSPLLQLFAALVMVSFIGLCLTESMCFRDPGG